MSNRLFVLSRYEEAIRYFDRALRAARSHPDLGTSVMALAGRVVPEGETPVTHRPRRALAGALPPAPSIARNSRAARPTMSILEAFKLSGKTALVTGCNQGIGRALASALAEAGADIVGVSRHLAETEAAAADVRAQGRDFFAHECDFSDREALFAFIRQVHADHPEIDILMNNAGVILRSPAAEFPDEYWDRVIQVNLDAQFFLAREFGRRMVERGRGKIIFTASMLSFQGGLNVPSYAAAKGAIPQLAMALSNEWSSQGVCVNCIAPGYIRTGVTAALQADPVRNPQILSRIPAGRWGDTADLKGAAVFLASAASDYVTGITIPVDGGWLGR